MVLSVEDASGLRALFQKAGTHAPSLAPDAVGATLLDRLGVDLLAESPAWGLAQRGARTVAFSSQAMGLSAPVRDAGAAKTMLASWLAQGPRRAGRVVGSRLLTASGEEAAALLKSMSRPVPLPRDLAARAKGPVWLWARTAEPLRGMMLSIEASGTGVVGRGVVAASGALLSGRAPAGCASGIACLRAASGPAGRRVLALALEKLEATAQPELATAARVEERVDAIDVRELAQSRSITRALRIAAIFDAPSCGDRAGRESRPRRDRRRARHHQSPGCAARRSGGGRLRRAHPVWAPAPQRRPAHGHRKPAAGRRRRNRSAPAVALAPAADRGWRASG